MPTATNDDTALCALPKTLIPQSPLMQGNCINGVRTHFEMEPSVVVMTRLTPPTISKFHLYSAEHGVFDPNQSNCTCIRFRQFWTPDATGVARSARRRAATASNKQWPTPLCLSATATALAPTPAGEIRGSDQWQ
jgi:hypothetical protein